jgi:hypothetical protein
MRTAPKFLKEVREPGTSRNAIKMHLRLDVACDGGGGGIAVHIGAYALASMAGTPRVQAHGFAIVGNSPV